MAHVCTKLFQVRAHDGPKVLVPERLRIADGSGIIGNAFLDLCNVPALRKDLGEVGTLNSIEHIHNKTSNVKLYQIVYRLFAIDHCIDEIQIMVNNTKFRLISPQHFFNHYPLSESIWQMSTDLQMHV